MKAETVKTPAEAPKQGSPSPEKIEEIQRRNREAIKREFEELKKSRGRADKIREDWHNL